MTWGLRRAVARRFPAPAAVAADPAHAGRLATYLTDLLTPYGLALGTATVAGQSYGEMAVALLDDLGDDALADTLVLAYDIPDVEPGRATATYLSHVCPGDPMAFAVSDQGRAGAHTGLRLLRGRGRGVLLVVEQSELPYDPGVPMLRPAAHAGVALALGESTVDGVESVVRPAAAAGDVVAELDRFAPATVILGGGLSDVDVRAEKVLHADPDQPMTGVWSVLADVWSPDAGRIVVADYDPLLRYLCVSVFGA
ncbi:2-hydroxy-acid oxidase [Dactylosporangium sp. AC04546]|uniref:2-hydroxy-acid oxidase n=1 Tax=Dactylosporangium sp. AC04546 TaxID=2862460 RepID=UPI001EDD37C5|nr:2-hydroxy-acid oxidase [Dactylosporangium sp. AC04546]WVK86185.1 2-hydroxy-acid oxidase [Dactylosporangium sp. AC04546]